MVPGMRLGLYLSSLFVLEAKVREEARVHSLPLPGGWGFPDPQLQFSETHLEAQETGEVLALGGPSLQLTCPVALILEPSR